MKRPLSKISLFLAGGLLIVLLPVIIGWKSGSDATTSTSTQSQLQKGKSPNVVPGIVVIKMKAGTPTGTLLKGSNRAAQLLKAAGVMSLQRAFPAARALSAFAAGRGMVDVSLIYFAKIAAGQDPVAIARRLDRSGEFEYAEPKYISHIFDTPNDPDYSAHQALYFSQMNAPAGWTLAKGDSNVVIADVDGGTFWQHPDLQANLWINTAEDANHDGKFEPTPSTVGGDDNGVDDDGNGYVDDVIGWNFANNSNNPIGLLSFNYFHGTGTASMFGAVTNNAVGMAGSSWNCRLMPICASSATTDGDIEFGYEGIQYAYSNGAKVINCSWGRAGAASRFEQDIINAATQAGALVVAAAGNDAANNDLVPQYPANYQNVLGVGALSSGFDLRASFSNYGVTVPVFAPGTDIWGAMTDGTTGDLGSGTSFATPLTSGLAGLLKSVNPSWTPQQIAVQIRMTADTIGPNMGHGRINFGRAVSESHAGLQIVSTTLLTPGGDKLFLPGDTVSLRMTVRNVLVSTASGLSFTVSSSDDSVLTPLQGATGPVSLPAGDSLVLPPLLLQVGTMSTSKAVLVKIDWSDVSAAGSEHDAYVFKVNVFPKAPTWDELQSPTFAGLFTVSPVDKQTIWSAGGNGLGTSPVVIRSEDGGATWTDVTGNLPNTDFYCMNAVDSSKAWVGTGDGRIFATTDGGTTWSEQTYPAPVSPFIDGIKIFPDLSGYALGDPESGGKFVILHTTDGGVTWQHLSNEPVGGPAEAGWNNSFFWTDPRHGWFGTNNNHVWRTADGGATWSIGKTPGTNSVAVSFADSLNGMAGYLTGGLAVSTDGGVSWGALVSPTTDAISSISYVPGSTYAWISDYGFPYLSRDRGATWTTQTTFPFFGSIYHGAFVDTTAGWMVTSYGEILRYGGKDTTINPPPPPSVPTAYVLAQNFPNPFNPTTTIRFKVPSRSRVKLAIYNILGQKIAELVDKEYAAGTYDQVWEANVASGIYFYRLEANSLVNAGQKYVDVKKMVVIK